MKVQRISSENDIFQVLVSLRDNRQKRAKRGTIFVEGVAPINALADSQPATHAVAFPRKARLSGWTVDTIDRLEPATGYEIAPDLMERLSDRADPSELIVIAARPRCELRDIVPGRDFTVAVVDRPANPGNLGSLVRSADGLGIHAVVTTGHGVDIYDPRVIRASLGACFSTPVVHEPSAKRLIAWLQTMRDGNPPLRVVGTDSGGATALSDARLSPPLAVVFGNEATGLSANLREVVDEVVAIPLRGRVDSLNLACAASILFYEVGRAAAGREQ